MNIIFLDVDGVLNSMDSIEQVTNRRPYSGYDYPFDNKCLSNLKRLVLETNAFIVLISTWRLERVGRDILFSELRKYRLDTRVIGCTENLNKSREDEIKAYLEILDENINYIIIDDDMIYPNLEEYLVKTDFRNGLTEEDTDVGIKKLTKKDKS